MIWEQIPRPTPQACLAMAGSQLAPEPSDVPREKMYNSRDGYTNPKPSSVVTFQTNVLWSPTLVSVPLQAADLYARRVHSARLHPQRPGQANHPPRSQPPAQGTEASPTRWCQAPAHPPGSHNPPCKGPVHPPSLSPGHPHREVQLHSRRGPATSARRGPRHTHGRPRDPAGQRRGTGRDRLGGGRPLPPPPGRTPSCLPRLGTCGQRDPWGTPPPRGPPQNGAAPRPRKPAAAPLRAPGARPAGLGTSRAHGGGGGGGGVCGQRAAAGLCGRGGQAAPQPRCFAAAGGSRAQRSAAAARLRTEHASGEGGATSARLRSPAWP